MKLSVSMGRMYISMNLRRNFIPLVLFLFCGFTADAQADSIFRIKDATQRLKAFNDWAFYNIYWENKETRNNRPHTLAILDKIYNKAAENGDERLEREAWFNIELWKIGGVVATFKPKDSTVNSILQAAESAHQRGWEYTEAECNVAASNIYFYNGNFKQSFDQSNKAILIIEKLGLENYPEANIHLAEIGDHYFHFFAYDSAISLIQRALKVKKPWSEIPKLYSILNTLAWAYAETGKNELAVYWYETAIESARKANEVFWLSMLNGDLGTLYFNLGKDSLAFPLLKYDFDKSVKAGYFNVAARAAGPLAAIYIRKGYIDSAQLYEKFFRPYMDKENEFGKVMLYKNLSAIYDYKKAYNSAYAYLDSANYFFNKDQREHGFSVLSRSKLLGDMEVYGARIKSLQAIQETQSVIKNVMLAMIFLGCISALMFIIRLQARKNIQVKTAQMEKKLATEELNHASAELDAFARAIKEKNELIDSLRERFEKIQPPDNSDNDKNAFFIELNDANILTEDDWRRFKELFDKVNPGFLIRLKERYPGLSAADTRLITLTKLGLNSREMATTLGVGYDAIRKARQRTRAKMDLDKDDSFEEAIEAI
ncbi:MAG: tetratricopeptide repeat protein [Chitinophagaceae bacterium]